MAPVYSSLKVAASRRSRIHPEESPMIRKPEPMTLIRCIVAIVFLTEGVLKLVHPQDLGAGRFARIGLPWPNVLGPFTAGVEIAGGLLLLADLVTAYAALALFGVISVALLTTKLPVLLNRPLGPFTLMKVPYYGILGFLHESRTDLCMFFGTLALFLDKVVRVPVSASKGEPERPRNVGKNLPRPELGKL
jgi:uncharacterized membrane protein YphA (DoxX/SURF4 family)